MGGPSDRVIFNLLRELADVIVVGAGTVRIENYSGAQLGVAQRQRRQARGQCEVPRLAIVTRVGPARPGHAGVHPHRGTAPGPDLHRGRR